jgi:hypothetical protein
MTKIFAFVMSSVLLVSAANADTSSLNLAIPSAPGNFQFDKFRSGELDCQNAIGSATTMEVGVTGIINKGYVDSANDYFNNDSRVGDVGVYARIVIPLGARSKERINCNDLYELELKQKRLEVMKLERELEQLRALQFEN